MIQSVRTINAYADRKNLCAFNESITYRKYALLIIVNNTDRWVRLITVGQAIMVAVWYLTPPLVPGI